MLVLCMIGQNIYSYFTHLALEKCHEYKKDNKAYKDMTPEQILSKEQPPLEKYFFNFDNAVKFGLFSYFWLYAYNELWDLSKCMWKDRKYGDIEIYNMLNDRSTTLI